MNQGFSELFEPHLALIGFCQLSGKHLQPGIDWPEEIEIERFAVKKMLDVDQYRLAPPLTKQPGTGFESPIAKSLQPFADEQIRLAQPSQQDAIWLAERLVRFRPADGNRT